LEDRDLAIRKFNVVGDNGENWKFGIAEEVPGSMATALDARSIMAIRSRR
jgi:hypothetical protein